MGDWDDEDFEPVVLPTPASSSAIKATTVLPPKPPVVHEDEEGGSWEDEDYQAPELLVSTLKTANRLGDEEEEDLVYEELNKKDIGGKPPAKVAEALAKKSAAEEAAILNQIKNGPQKNETAEQRKIRERKQQEEADIAQAIDAFDGFTVADSAGNGASKQKQDTFASLTKGVGSVVLKTKQDHTNFGANTYIKLLNSPPSCIAEFYSGLNEILRQSTVTLAILSPVVEEIKVANDAVEKRDRLAGVVHKEAAKPKATTKKVKKVIDEDDGDFWGDDGGDYMGESTVSAIKASEVEVEGTDSALENMKKEHNDFGRAVQLKLQRSTVLNIVALYKGLAPLLSVIEWTFEDINSIYQEVLEIQTAREKVESKLPKVKSAKETKKETKEKKERIKNIFGDSDYVERYDDLANIEDDYIEGTSDHLYR